MAYPENTKRYILLMKEMKVLRKLLKIQKKSYLLEWKRLPECFVNNDTWTNAEETNEECLSSVSECNQEQTDIIKLPDNAMDMDVSEPVEEVGKNCINMIFFEQIGHISTSDDHINDKMLESNSILDRAVLATVLKPGCKNRSTLTSIGPTFKDIQPMTFISNDAANCFKSRMSTQDDEFCLKVLKNRNVFSNTDQSEQKKYRRNKCQNLCRGLRLYSEIQAYRCLFGLIFCKDAEQNLQLRAYIHSLMMTNNYFLNQLASFLGSSNNRYTGLDPSADISLESKPQKIIGQQSLLEIKKQCYNYNLFINEKQKRDREKKIKKHIQLQ